MSRHMSSTAAFNSPVKRTLIFYNCRSMQCLHGWWPYLKLALPTVGACCLEWWLYEGLILIAGWFPNADVAVAAMGVGFNTTALTYTISTGIGGLLLSSCKHLLCSLLRFLGHA